MMLTETIKERVQKDSEFARALLDEAAKPNKSLHQSLPFCFHQNIESIYMVDTHLDHITRESLKNKKELKSKRESSKLVFVITI
ncbi:MAG: hypothetical protein COB67_13895 [SAR324 cluster bacterium]|uniref:Uncharacterized protein n=1 Tax=SAR324 cluster bacterium TaxID=2024889 RepID=A0A2A4SKU0_9DELT|nr:MAG: hypothetical protein COB67_13895 [SAR324 cluster bacterium]